MLPCSKQAVVTLCRVPQAVATGNYHYTTHTIFSRCTAPGNTQDWPRVKVGAYKGSAAPDLFIASSTRAPIQICHKTKIPRFNPKNANGFRRINIQNCSASKKFKQLHLYSTPCLQSNSFQSHQNFRAFKSTGAVEGLVRGKSQDTIV